MTQTQNPPTKSHKKKKLPPPSPLSSRELSSRDKAKIEVKKKMGEMLLNRVPMSAIAESLGMSVFTLAGYKGELEKEWREEQLKEIGTLKARELLALDQMERECIVRAAAVDVLGMTAEELALISIGKLRAMINDEGLWFDRRLRVMQERSKMLGIYPKPEPEQKQQPTNQDNRQVNILIQTPSYTGRGETESQPGIPVKLGDYIRGVLESPALTQPNNNGMNGNGNNGHSDP